MTTPSFSSDATLPVVERWPWNQRSAWLLGTLLELRDAPESHTTLGRFTVECAHNLDLPDGGDAWVNVGACWPKAIPESAIGRDVIVRMSPWKRRHDGRAFRGTTWKWA